MIQYVNQFLSSISDAGFTVKNFIEADRTIDNNAPNAKVAGDSDADHNLDRGDPYNFLLKAEITNDDGAGPAVTALMRVNIDLNRIKQQLLVTSIEAKDGICYFYEDLPQGLPLPTAFQIKQFLESEKQILATPMLGSSLDTIAHEYLYESLKGLIKADFIVNGPIDLASITQQIIDGANKIPDTGEYSRVIQAAKRYVVDGEELSCKFQFWYHQDTKHLWPKALIAEKKGFTFEFPAVSKKFPDLQSVNSKIRLSLAPKPDHYERLKRILQNSATAKKVNKITHN